MHLYFFTTCLTILYAVEGASLPGCDIVIEKDGTVIEDGGIAVAVGGLLNQVYCKVTCSEAEATSALKWWDDGNPVPWTRGRRYQVRANFEKMNILTIRNALHRDMGVYKCTGWVKGYRKLTKTVHLRFGCGPDAHRCDSSKCVDKSVICDGTYDCKDRTDEMNCETCHGDQFQCDEKCIPKSERCDGFYDCRDLSDEADCGCGDDFTCYLMENCVPQDKVCDGVRDCMYGDDENDCTHCSTTEFHCGLGRCISGDNVCDGIEQCADGSDERNCPCNGYECADGTCISSENVKCNGISECPLNDDEDGCVKLSGPEIILAPVETIEVAVGGSFVITCEATGEPTPQIAWRKDWSEILIDDRIFVSSQNGRGLLSVNNVRISDSGSYTCEASNSQGQVYAIPDTSVVVSHCSTTEFHCGFGTCISGDNVCDGIEQCVDGSDEQNCPCNGYECSDGTCIPSDNVKCNGIYECPLHDDEDGCVKLSPPEIILAPVKKIIVPVGGSFVITCEATGEPTPQIAWRKDRSEILIDDRMFVFSQNGLGRLGVNNVRMSDSGSYTCEASNSQGQTLATPDTFVVVYYCLTTEFYCGSGTFISDKSVCDGTEQCVDGSDERNCKQKDNI